MTTQWLNIGKKVNITPTVHLTTVFLCSHRENKNQFIVWEPTILLEFSQSTDLLMLLIMLNETYYMKTCHIKMWLTVSSLKIWFEFTGWDMNYPWNKLHSQKQESCEKNLCQTYFFQFAEICSVSPFTFTFKYLCTETLFRGSEARWTQNIIAIRDMLSFQKICLVTKSWRIPADSWVAWVLNLPACCASSYCLCFTGEIHYPHH